MKKYKPTIKKKPVPKKTTPAPKKNSANTAESGDELVDPDQAPQDKVVETNDQDT